MYGNVRRSPRISEKYVPISVMYINVRNGDHSLKRSHPSELTGRGIIKEERDVSRAEGGEDEARGKNVGEIYMEGFGEENPSGRREQESRPTRRRRQRNQ